MKTSAQHWKPITAFYHVASPEAARKIMQEGLERGPDRRIHLLSTPDLRAIISEAQNRIGLNDFVVLEVCASGISRRPHRMDVQSEMYSGDQWQTCQKNIEAKHITEAFRLQVVPGYSHSAVAFFASNAIQRLAVAEFIGKRPAK